MDRETQRETSVTTADKRAEISILPPPLLTPEQRGFHQSVTDMSTVHTHDKVRVA